MRDELEQRSAGGSELWWCDYMVSVLNSQATQNSPFLTF